jgi:hypothetical protein
MGRRLAPGARIVVAGELDPVDDSEAVRRRRAAERSSVAVPCSAPPPFATLHTPSDPASGARRRRVLLAIAEPALHTPSDPASGARRRRVLLAIAELSLHAMLERSAEAAFGCGHPEGASLRATDGDRQPKRRSSAAGSRRRRQDDRTTFES